MIRSEKYQFNWKPKYNSDEDLKLVRSLEKLVKEIGSKEAQRFTTWANNNKSTSQIESQTTLETAICSECFFDRDLQEKDNKRFDNEMDNIDQKLTRLT